MNPNKNIDHYCNSIIYKYWIDTIQRSAVQANINNEIVDHITNIRNKTKALQQEGKAILEVAKQKVEKIIIG